LVSAIVIFGVLMYVFKPVVAYLHELFPTSGNFAEAMFFMWSILAIINLFGSGIRYMMKMQER